MFIEDVIYFNQMLYFFTNNDMVKVKNGYTYQLTTIDVFTKMVWVYPMRANTCKNGMKCFKDILKKCGDKPKHLNTDRGS